MSLCYVGMGSNLGNRIEHMRAGVRALEETGRVLDVSSVYESKAWGLEDQPDFLNAVALMDTDATPLSLLRELKSVESRFHRDKRRWGPRELDLDILLFQGIRVKMPVLTVPHPMIRERGFVVIPLLELQERGWPDLGFHLEKKAWQGVWFYADKEAIWQGE